MNTTFTLSAAVGETSNRQRTTVEIFPRTLTHSSDLAIEHLCEGRVIIIGDAFENHSSNVGKDFHQEDSTEILRRISTSRWGRFVAIAYNQKKGEIAIYRDPSGMVPCYYSRNNGRVSIATDARAILNDLRRTAPIDWTSVANCLLAPDRRRRETCLHGIAEILPGEVAIISREGVHHDQLWSPDDHVGTRLDIDFEEAVTILESTLSRTIGTWCQRYHQPLISISGGFDSSAIAALAARNGPIGLLVFFADSPHADERRYAECVAKHLGYDLHQSFCDPNSVIVAQNLSSARPRPSARSFTQVFDNASVEQGRVTGASAHFNGGGGDNVFGKLHSAYPLTDRFRCTGLSPKLVTTALNICGATGASLPMVLRQAMAALRGRDRAILWPDTTDMLSVKAVEMRDIQLHPWLDAVKNRYPGQRQQIRNVARATASTDHLNIADSLPTIYPILSQPVVELCISLPTWFWFHGGRDRALARTAMSAYLPQYILDRRLKGAFDGLAYQIVDHNRKQIMTDLQSGVLASQGLIDVRAVHSVLDAQGANEEKVIHVLHLHEVEMWCRHWC